MIRYGGCIWGPEEIEAVTAVLNSGNWACGEKVQEFERQVAAWQGRQHALFVNSGTSALLLAMAALPEGSRVAMPALQFATLYSAAKWCGHTPVLVDIDDSLNMDPQKLLQVISGLDAVAFVHMAGNPENIEEVAALCRLRGIPLLEDACEAFGSESGGAKAGNFGLVSAFSTHGAHHISTGEGGIVFTDNQQAYDKMHRIRDWGRAYGAGDSMDGYYPGYVFGELGLNLHATDIQAALGIVQLSRVQWFIEARRYNYEYLAGHTSVFPFQRPYVQGPHRRASWFTFPMLVAEGERDELMAHLTTDGIESRPVVAGNMARQPISCRGNDPSDFPVADKWYRRGLWISVHPKLTVTDLNYIVGSLGRFWSEW